MTEPTLIGFRSFVVRDGALVSPTTTLPWSATDWMRTTCRVARHEAPAAGCTCGFRAYYTPEQHAKAVGDEADRMLVGSILGSVVAADPIVREEVGFRAASMRVLALVPEFPPELGQFLGLSPATRYTLRNEGFVFFESIDELVDHAARHGRIDPPDTDEP